MRGRRAIGSPPLNISTELPNARVFPSVCCSAPAMIPALTAGLHEIALTRIDETSRSMQHSTRGKSGPVGHPRGVPRPQNRVRRSASERIPTPPNILPFVENSQDFPIASTVCTQYCQVRRVQPVYPARWATRGMHRCHAPIHDEGTGHVHN